jgi:proteasome lid subunit RPN8/RPN11
MNNYDKWVSSCGRYTVYFKKYCFEIILGISIKHLPNETGSSMVGYYSQDGFEAFIEEISLVPRDSKSSKYSFIRGTAGLRQFYKMIKSKYSGLLFYVGEWHSHPFAVPYPSATDDINQFAISNDKATNCPESILVIIGEDLKNDPNYHVYVYSRKRGRIQLIKVFD